VPNSAADATPLSITAMPMPLPSSPSDHAVVAASIHGKSGAGAA
jgi:hypothetical protein